MAIFQREQGITIGPGNGLPKEFPGTVIVFKPNESGGIRIIPRKPFSPLLGADFRFLVTTPEERQRAIEEAVAQYNLRYDNKPLHNPFSLPGQTNAEQEKNSNPSTYWSDLKEGDLTLNKPVYDTHPMTFVPTKVTQAGKHISWHADAPVDTIPIEGKSILVDIRDRRDTTGPEREATSYTLYQLVFDGNRSTTRNTIAVDRVIPVRPGQEIPITILNNGPLVLKGGDPDFRDGITPGANSGKLDGLKLPDELKKYDPYVTLIRTNDSDYPISLSLRRPDFLFETQDISDDNKKSDEINLGDNNTPSLFGILGIVVEAPGYDIPKALYDGYTDRMKRHYVYRSNPCTVFQLGFPRYGNTLQIPIPKLDADHPIRVKIECEMGTEKAFGLFSIVFSRNHTGEPIIQYFGSESKPEVNTDSAQPLYLAAVAARNPIHAATLWGLRVQNGLLNTTATNMLSSMIPASIETDPPKIYVPAVEDLFTTSK